MSLLLKCIPILFIIICGLFIGFADAARFIEPPLNVSETQNHTRQARCRCQEYVANLKYKIHSELRLFRSWHRPRTGLHQMLTSQVLQDGDGNRRKRCWPKRCVGRAGQYFFILLFVCLFIITTALLRITKSENKLFFSRD